MDLMRTLEKAFKSLMQNISRILEWLITVPYYRLYRFNTLDPIIRIASYAARPNSLPLLLITLSRWRDRKVTELQFISIATAVLSAGVIGAFSWATIPDAYWLASALWYCALLTSILGLLLAAQQLAVLNILGDVPENVDHARTAIALRFYLPLLLSVKQTVHLNLGGEEPLIASSSAIQPRRKMIFTWQCPIMFMSYSVCFFIAGLTLTICTPLIQNRPWGAESNIAVVYLGVGALATMIFVFCGFWVYHYIDLEAVETQLETGSFPSRRWKMHQFSTSVGDLAHVDESSAPRSWPKAGR